jgi:dihydropteroate synthase
MGALVAERGVPFIAMHWRAHSTVMQSFAVYDDVVADVSRELMARVEALTGAGVAAENIVLDPGFGFAKKAEHNWELLRRLDEVMALGHRLLVGTSRKTFLGHVGRTPDAVRPHSRSRRRHGRDHGARGPARRVGGAGARRRQHHRHPRRRRRTARRS